MKRALHERWEPIPAVPRTIKGNENKQRPASQYVPDLPQRQEDSCYHTAEMGRISAEMVRPIITPITWGGYDVEMLRIASLARLVQIRAGYLHTCSPAYCLKDLPCLLCVLMVEHACAVFQTEIAGQSILPFLFSLGTPTTSVLLPDP